MARRRPEATLCDNRRTVFTPRHLPALLLAALAATLGCHAQTPAAAGKPLSPELERRVEVLLRTKANVPPGATVNVGPRTPSELPGYDVVGVTVTNEGNTSHPINFLLSSDGKTLAQFTKYDIAANPRDFLSADGRPARGGPATAPVLIVGFDDLECPYCARLHASIFPAITNRYGDKVHIVYKDFPLDTIHPWAVHAAVDVECMAAQSPAGYWSLVDGIHARAGDITKVAQDASPEPAKELAVATKELDTLTREQGKLLHVDAAKLDACVTKQDDTAVKASEKSALALNLDSAPVLFINGDKIDGAVPIEFIFNIIDKALIAEGQTPPPPYTAPKPPVTPATLPAAPKGAS